MKSGNGTAERDEFNLREVSFCQIASRAARNYVFKNITDIIFYSVKSYCFYFRSAVMTRIFPKNRKLFKTDSKFKIPTFCRVLVGPKSSSNSLTASFRSRPLPLSMFQLIGSVVFPHVLLILFSPSTNYPIMRFPISFLPGVGPCIVPFLELRVASICTDIRFIGRRYFHIESVA